MAVAGGDAGGRVPVVVGKRADGKPRTACPPAGRLLVEAKGMMVCPCAIHRDGVESLFASMIVAPLGMSDPVWFALRVNESQALL